MIKQAEDPQNKTGARVVAYQKAIAACPDQPSLYIGLTTILINSQQIPEPLNWTRKGLSQWPESADLNRNLGVALLAEGHAEAALQTLEKLPPSSETEFEIGMAYRALDNHAMARKDLALAYADGRKDPYILYALVQEDRALGDRKAGLEDFGTLVHDFPDSAWVHLLIGDAYSDRHRPADASREYLAAASAQPAMPIVHFNLGRLAFNRGANGEAESDFRKELQIDATFGEAHLYLGETLLREGKQEEAVSELRRAVAYSPNSSLAYQALAVAEDDSGHADAALAILKEGEQRFPNDAAFPGQQARILSRQGRSVEAAQQAALAESSSRRGNPQHFGGNSPDDVSDDVEPGLTRKADGLEDVSGGLGLGSALASVKKNPTNASAWLSLGHLQQAADDQASAVHSFLQAQQLQPESAPPLYSIGMSFFLLGLDTSADDYYARSARHFEAALKLDAKYDRAVFMLGVIGVVRSKFSEACAHIQQAIALKPENAYYHLQYGILLGRMGKAQEASDEMKKSELLDPTNAQCHLSLGGLYVPLGEYPVARAELEKAVELNPRLSSAYYALGSVYHHLGLESESQAAYSTFEQQKNAQSGEPADPVSGAVAGRENASSR